MDVNTDSDDGSTYQSSPEILVRYELMSSRLSKTVGCQRRTTDNEVPLAGAEFNEELECARLPRLQRLETSTPPSTQHMVQRFSACHQQIHNR
jgi:hypothetical protein